MTAWSNPSTPQQPVILRERSGWGAPIALTLVAATFSVAQPGLLLLIPLGLLLLAAPPRRPALVVLGAFLLAFVLVGQAGDVLWWFGRGWALMLGALFLVITVLRPESSFLDRALGTVFGTAVGAAGLLAVRSGWTSLDMTVAQKLRESASAAEAQFGPAFAARKWNTQPLEAMHRAADLQALVFPALLALASLAALGVTWWVWRRVTVRDANPLSALREFRFRDELVWLVVAAVLLVVLPLGQIASRAGTNLATFMGALYALRGLAIIVAVYGVPSPFQFLLGMMLLVFLFPIMIASTVVLGLTDTWVDLRSRARSSSPRPPH
jgi:hypothetical protein